MIKVCPNCSNVDIAKLKETVGEENVKRGCIGQCRAYKKEAVGVVDGELVIKENENDFLEFVKKA